jgi:hypothetical protein
VGTQREAEKRATGPWSLGSGSDAQVTNVTSKCSAFLQWTSVAADSFGGIGGGARESGGGRDGGEEGFE